MPEQLLPYLTLRYKIFESYWRPIINPTKFENMVQSVFFLNRRNFLSCVKSQRKQIVVTKMSTWHGQFILRLCQYWFYFENANQEIFLGVVSLNIMRGNLVTCRIRSIKQGLYDNRGRAIWRSLFRDWISEKLYCTYIGYTFNW